MSDDKPRRYIEGDDVRARRGFAARDTGRHDVPAPPDDDDEHTPVEGYSPRILLAKLQTHATYQREQLEAMHHKIRVGESSQAQTTNRVESLEGWRKVTMAIVGAVAVAALGSLWTAYTAARDAGARDGRVDTQIDALRGAVDKLESQIESLWRVRVRSSTGDLP